VVRPEEPSASTSPQHREDGDRPGLFPRPFFDDNGESVLGSSLRATAKTRSPNG
jgi:hypothetical protein